MAGEWNKELEESSRIALKKLEDAGATCVIGDAGYFFRYAQVFSKLTKLPVLGSAVNMIPVIEQTLMADEKILILGFSGEEL